MDEYAKASLLFTYLNDFKRMATTFFSLSDEDATVLYYLKIEVYKLQLQQEVELTIAKKMYNDLSISILKSFVIERRDGKLWQFKSVPFQNTLQQNAAADDSIDLIK